MWLCTVFLHLFITTSSHTWWYAYRVLNVNCHSSLFWFQLSKCPKAINEYALRDWIYSKPDNVSRWLNNLSSWPPTLSLNSNQLTTCDPKPPTATSRVTQNRLIELSQGLLDRGLRETVTHHFPVWQRCGTNNCIGLRNSKKYCEMSCDVCTRNSKHFTHIILIYYMSRAHTHYCELHEMDDCKLYSMCTSTLQRSQIFYRYILWQFLNVIMHTSWILFKKERLGS